MRFYSRWILGINTHINLIKIIEWASDFAYFIGCDMCVDLGCFRVFMPQDLLDISEVCTLFQQMSGKTVSQTVRRCMFLYASLFESFFEYFGNACCTVLASVQAFKQPVIRAINPVVFPQ